MKSSTLQKKQGGRLLKLLLEKQLVTEQDMMVSMGRCLGAHPVTLAKMRVPQDVIDLIPKDLGANLQDGRRRPVGTASCSWPWPTR
jgi:hypothetical protein